MPKNRYQIYTSTNDDDETIYLMRLASNPSASVSHLHVQHMLHGIFHCETTVYDVNATKQIIGQFFSKIWTAWRWQNVSSEAAVIWVVALVLNVSVSNVSDLRHFLNVSVSVSSRTGGTDAPVSFWYRHSDVSVSSLGSLGLDIIRLIYNRGSHKQYLQVMQSRVAAQTVLVTTDKIFL